MDQIILATIFILSLIAGVVVLIKPVWDIFLAILKYLQFVTRGPFKTEDKTNTKKIK